MRDVWGPLYEKETNYLRVFMAQIRKKLEPDPHGLQVHAVITPTR
jgi:two-component system KDP operon response regulator KdpE